MSDEPEPVIDPLAGLAGEVVAAVKNRTRLPVLRDRDVLAIVDRIHVETDRGMEKHAASAQAEGHTIACGDCHGCCENVVITYEGEVLRIVAYLNTPEGADARAHFRARFPAWRDALGDALDTIKRAPDGLRAALADAHRKRVECAFLRDGRCTVYAVRPMTCRASHALDTPVQCNGDHTEEPKVWAWGPLMEYLDHMQPLHLGLHAARRPGKPPEPLCVAVSRHLGEAAPPSRNAPCPCGSGKKYKQCCGSAG